MRVLYYISVLLFCVTVTTAQDDLYVEQRSQTEVFKYKTKNSLEINGERADIYVEGVKGDEIKIEAITSSKNSSRAQAKEDIDKMNVLIEKIGKVIYARNYISISSKEEKPNSNLKVAFKISMPENCQLIINNAFGEIQVQNVKGQIKIDSRYSKINLAYLEGIGNIRSVLGDVNMHSSYGEYDYSLSRCDLTLQNSDGSYDIESKLGKVTAGISTELENFTVKGESVDVTLVITDLLSAAYNLISKNGKIEIDRNFDLEYQIEEVENIQKLELNKEIDCSKLDIDTEFGDIILNKTAI